MFTRDGQAGRGARWSRRGAAAAGDLADNTVGKTVGTPLRADLTINRLPRGLITRCWRRWSESLGCEIEWALVAGRPRGRQQRARISGKDVGAGDSSAGAELHGSAHPTGRRLWESARVSVLFNGRYDCDADGEA